MRALTTNEKIATAGVLTYIIASYSARNWTRQAQLASDPAALLDAQTTVSMWKTALLGGVGAIVYSAYQKHPRLVFGFGTAVAGLAVASEVLSTTRKRRDGAHATGYPPYVATAKAGAPYWLANLAPGAAPSKFGAPSGYLREDWGVYSAQAQGAFVFINVDGEFVWMRASDLQWAITPAIPGGA